MTQILIDGIANISFHNGVLRVQCTTAGPDGQQHSSGTLIIPGPIAGPIVQALANGLKELEKKIVEHQQQMPTAGNA